MDTAIIPEVPTQLQVVSFLAGLSGPTDTRHPFWVFESDQIVGLQVVACSLVLFLAGLLCSAGGIGGGGIYVTVLMVAGCLSPHDAVPLSKAIVFFGAIASLVLNLQRDFGGSKWGKHKPSIDYDICSLVVPSSLIGTLLGVLFNRICANSTIVGMLTVILVAMTVMVTWTTWNQYLEEEKPLSLQPELPHTGSTSANADVTGYTGLPHQVPAGDTCALEIGVTPEERTTLVAKDIKSPRRNNSDIAACLLLMVIFMGVMRHHAGACLWELQQNLTPPEACHHPLVRILAWDRLEGLMSDPQIANWVMFLTLALPIATCLVAMAISGHACMRYSHWSVVEVTEYMAMGVVTGCLAGLVGIGGGLIFSPFFLIKGVDPVVAVATSSTCVIFTSSSTTVQYLLTDRVIISLACVYGLINLLASYAGTAFVHFLQDHFSSRKSYISAIVAVGVIISALLAVRKFMVPEAVEAFLLTKSIS